MVERAPDLIEPLIGYRLFRVGEDGELFSPFWRQPMQLFARGRNEARCLRRRFSLNDWIWHGFRHHPAGAPAPAPGCSCGLYAYHDPELDHDDRTWIEGREVWAAVVASGQAELYNRGFRAQELEIVALCPTNANPPSYDQICRAAKRYQVPWVRTLSELRAHALEHGAPAPAALLPPAGSPSQRRMRGRDTARRLATLFLPLWALFAYMLGQSSAPLGLKILLDLITLACGSVGFVVLADNHDSRQDRLLLPDGKLVRETPLLAESTPPLL